MQAIKKLSRSLREFPVLIKNSASEFAVDDGFKLSAALSYYTIFSLPPMIIIVITLASAIFGNDAVEGQLYAQISTLVGSDAALQIQQSVAHMALKENNLLATIISVSILLITASTAFADMQGSLNQIWGLRAKPEKSLKLLIQNRILSFAMIASLGFLLMVSLAAHMILSVLHQWLMLFLPISLLHLFDYSNAVLAFILFTFLFTFIFKLLPDAVIPFRFAFAGALSTAVLFQIGKYLIGLYLGSSGVASVYGAAGSVIVILAWVYYSANILFFGAEFTRVLALKSGYQLVPKPYCVAIDKG